MATNQPPVRRQRGAIRRRGGSFQVRVYAGVDPVTGRDRYLTESAPTERAAEKTRTRLVAKVDEKRNAETQATLGYVLDAWLEAHEGAESTLAAYQGYVENIIKPALGNVPVAKITARELEKLYGQLRRCRERCGGTAHEHRPLAASSIRQVHAILSGALSAAVRWEWVGANPAEVARKPRLPTPQPTPPSADDAARLVETAWEQDPDWGMFVWLAMVTGARRGELLALRWDDINLERGVVEIRRSYSVIRGRAQEKQTKTHQIRRLRLDTATTSLLGDHRSRYEQRVRALGIAAKAGAFVFSAEPDHSRPSSPNYISHRYARMCKALGIADTRLHSLRHYTATELLASGADLRTIAGRLGHAGGGATTLKVYAAWVAEADQRAAEVLAGRLPRPPKASADT